MAPENPTAAESGPGGTVKPEAPVPREGGPGTPTPIRRRLISMTTPTIPTRSPSPRRRIGGGRGKRGGGERRRRKGG